MEVYSQRLGKIRPEQFQAALARFNLGRFIRAEGVPSGLFGQNVFVTSTQGEFVLRGVPHFAWQFPTERFFVDQLHAKTATPVPYPYRLDLSSDIFGWAYAIMPRLPGASPADPGMANALSPEDRLSIARALAHTLADAHQLTWEYAGSYDPKSNTVAAFGVTYREWVAQRIRQKLALARDYNEHTTDADLAWAEAIIAGAAPDQPFTPCAVLGDYGEHNVVVAHNADGWRVSGVFDLMTAHFGDGDADLCMAVGAYLKVNPALADEFVRQYLRRRPARPGFVERQALYTLGLYASMWEYWQRVQGGPPENSMLNFEQWAKPAVSYWREDKDRSFLPKLKRI